MHNPIERRGPAVAGLAQQQRPCPDFFEAGRPAVHAAKLAEAGLEGLPPLIVEALDAGNTGFRCENIPAVEGLLEVVGLDGGARGGTTNNR